MRAAKVLYVTEEHSDLWIERRDTFGIGDYVHALCRPMTGKPCMTQWLAFIKHLQRHVDKGGVDLVVLDTLSNFWPVRDENNAAEVQEALMPLHTLTEKAGLMAVHHLRKADGQEGTGARGSGALAGFVDTIMELRRFDPNAKGGTKRVLTAYGRHRETPAEIVLDFDPVTMTFRAEGTRQEATKTDATTALLRLLPHIPPGMSYDAIVQKWDSDTKVPSKTDLLATLSDGVARGKWWREGKGRKGSPSRRPRQNLPSLSRRH